MPELSANQLRVIKVGYLQYRRDKMLTLAPETVSPFMQGAMNAIETKLDFRGRIDATVPSEGIVKAVKADKKARVPAQREHAKNALKHFLEAALGQGGAPDLDAELKLLGAYCQETCKFFGGVRFIPGPLKMLEKAMGKTETFGLAFGLNRDLARGTLACKSQPGLTMATSFVKKLCVAELGMHLVKQEEQKSIRDGGDSKSGYSGWNFGIQFKEHRAFSAELQANTLDVLYGKMGMAEFCRDLLVSQDDYRRMQTQLGFPGGLGHALYDISDTVRAKTTKDEGDLARKLGKDYYDACRGEFRKTNIIALNERIMTFGKQLKTDKAVDLWKKALRECGWAALLPQSHARVVTKSVRLS